MKTLANHIAQMDQEATLVRALIQAERTYRIAQACGDRGKQISAATDMHLLTYRITQQEQAHANQIIHRDLGR